MLSLSSVMDEPNILRRRGLQVNGGWLSRQRAVVVVSRETRLAQSDEPFADDSRH